MAGSSAHTCSADPDSIQGSTLLRNGSSQALEDLTAGAGAPPPLRTYSWGCDTQRRGLCIGWEAERQNLTQGGSWSLQSFQTTPELPGFLLSGLGPGSLPSQRGWANQGGDDSCMNSRLLEAHMLSAVIGVQGLPCCRGRGAASASAHEPQGPRMLQTGSFQAAKEGDPWSWQPATPRD